MIQVDGLVRKYGETVAVGGISFYISPGEVVGFLGPNGAGKTTTLKVLAGFLDPSDGRVTLNDQDVLEHPLECRAMIGYLPENNPLYEEMEVFEYLDWGASVRGLRGKRKSAAMRRAIDRCGLGNVVGQDIGTLSKGYRQRVGLAQSIVHDPSILLLDEPTSGLDPNQASEVRDLIAELRKEKTVLISTHILSEVRASCDRVIIINKGQIAAQGKPDELARDAAQETRVRLVIQGKKSSAVAEQLRKLPGVKSVATQVNNGEAAYLVAVDPSAKDVRLRVFGLAAENKWPVLELYLERASLEDIFQRLTA